MSHLREKHQKAAQARWSKPETVDQRVDLIVESARRKLDKLPPLTPAQRAKVAALLSPTALTASQDGGRSDG